MLSMKKLFGKYDSLIGLEGLVDYHKGWIRVGGHWVGVHKGRLHKMPVIAGGTSANSTQEDFWFRNDDGSLTTATYISTQNSNYGPTLTGDLVFRIRIIAQENNGKNDPWAFQLAAQKNGTGGYSLITNTPVGGISYSDDANSIADAAAIGTADFDLTWSGTPVAGEYDDGTSVLGMGTIAINGSFTEVEFCLKITFADISDSDYFEFQLQNTSGTALDGYTRTPRMDVTVGATTHTASATLNGAATIAAVAQTILAAKAVLAGAATLAAVGYLPGQRLAIDFEEGDKSDFDTETGGGNLSVSGTAAQVGSYGMEVDATTAAGADAHGNNPLSIGANEINFRFYCDPNTLSIGTADREDVLVIRTDGTVGGVSTFARIIFRENSGTDQITIYTEDDSGTTFAGAYVTLPTAPFYVEGYVKRASSAVASDGESKWWLGGTLQTGDTGIDNYDIFATITESRFGIDNLNATTTGVLYLDDLIISDDGVTIGAASGDVLGVANLQASATLVASGSVVHGAQAALAGSATLAAIGQRIIQAAAALSGSATLTAIAQNLKQAQAQLDGSAAVVADGSLELVSAAQLDGGSTVVAVGTILGTVAGTAQLNGAATLIASGSVVYGASTQLNGIATLTAVGTLLGTVTGKAQLDGSSTLTATASIIHGASASIAGAATLTADAAVTYAGAAVLNGVATLTAAGTTSTAVLGAAVLNGVATMSALGVLELGGVATLAGSSLLTAAGQRLVGGSAVLAGSSSLQGAGVLLLGGQANLLGTATLSANGSILGTIFETIGGPVQITRTYRIPVQITREAEEQVQVTYDIEEEVQL